MSCGGLGSDFSQCVGGDRVRLLVLTTDYPHPDGKVSQYYVHTRNVYYASQGLTVEVLSFSTQTSYSIDGIQVLSLRDCESALAHRGFDALVLHAPNIRNHYRFLRKHHSRFPKLVFVFHGHEVLRCSAVYPKPYSYDKKSQLRLMIGDLYDTAKLRVWRNCFERFAHKSWFVFVSRWMYNEFIKWLGIDPGLIEPRKSVIYNSVGWAFESQSYDEAVPKVFDFVTIRSDLDSSKYCIDIVTRLARENPNHSFCVVGHGRFFKFNARPKNLHNIEKYLSHLEIVDLLNQSRCALLPTRADAQGVMACESATFGMPVITSDIPVAREVFAGFQNVAFIDNDSPVQLAPILERLTSFRAPTKNPAYFACNTTGAEVELLRSLLRGS